LFACFFQIQSLFPFLKSKILAKGDDIVCSSDHLFSSKTSAAKLLVSCDNTTSSTLSSQNCFPTLPTSIATQSGEPLSNVVALHSSGTTQSDCSDELENTPLRVDYYMTHANTINANTNSTSELSEFTDNTFISSNQYASQPDNQASSTDVPTQTDSALVSHDNNSSHDSFSANISELIQSPSSTVDLALGDS